MEYVLNKTREEKEMLKKMSFLDLYTALYYLCMACRETAGDGEFAAAMRRLENPSEFPWINSNNNASNTRKALGLLWRVVHIATPLHQAVDQGDYKLIKRLLDAGISVNIVRYGNAKLNERVTPLLPLGPPDGSLLHSVVYRGRDVPVLKDLLRRGADPSIKSDWGRYSGTAAHWARQIIEHESTESRIETSRQKQSVWQKWRRTAADDARSSLSIRSEMLKILRTSVQIQSLKAAAKQSILDQRAAAGKSSTAAEVWKKLEIPKELQAFLAD